MSHLEIKSWRGHVLATTDAYDTLNAWAVSGNLREANLRGANLRGANLYGANLYGADLREADLYGADLRGADLRGTNLRGANLYGADLYGADLYEADLRGADLRGTNLRGTNLRGAYLRDANLLEANLREAEGVIDGGQDTRGYRVVGWMHDDQLMIKAGCRNFTLAEARAHWGGADYLEDHDAATQAEMVARVGLIAAVARAWGWQFGE